MNSKTLIKSDKILRSFTPGEPLWTVSELAKKTDMPVTTLHGILADLVEMDFLSLNPVSKEYRIGFRYMEMGALHAITYELNNIAHGIMHELVFSAGSLSGMSVMYKGWMYVSITVMPLHSTQGLKYVGPRLPAHMSAGGMVVLSHLPENIVEQYLSLNWENAGIGTPITNSDLKKEIELVRKRGYSLGRSFGKTALFETIGVPIFGRNGQILSGLVLFMPDSNDFSPDQQNLMLEKLIFAASEITQRCGHLSQTASYV